MARLTGAEILWDCLVREGVTDLFGYPGGAILPAYDAMLKYPIRHVLVRHEQGATHMADGYARASGRVGVAVATSGPGATNMVTGIATAMMDSSPIVCITGQVGSRLIGSDAFQETDITGITLPDHEAQLPRHARRRGRVGRPRGVPRRQVRPARSRAHRHHEGRAAVVVRVRLGRRRAVAGCHSSRRPSPAEASMRQALELIRVGSPAARARRPRADARQRHARSSARSSTRRASPSPMTLLGIGCLPASHPLNLGMMGMHGEAWVNTAIQEADLLIALGMRFDDRVTGNLKTYAQNARKIHVDIDPAEIGKNVPVDVGIVADVRDVLRIWQPALETLDLGDWTGRIDALKGDSAVRDIQKLPDDGHLYAAHVIHDLWRATNGQAVVVTDVGQHQMWEAQYYHHELPRTLITSGGLGTMGFALPAAIGAKMACPDAEVWAVVGDGGFQMTHVRAGDDSAGAAEGQHRDHQQRLPRHGPAVAGVLLRAPLRGDAAAQPGLREARRRVRHRVARGHAPQGGHAGRRGRARARRSGAARFPGGAGRLGVPDGARPARISTR